MEQAISCHVEDVQTPSGDDDVSKMSVITVESTSPPESVRSINSLEDDMDEYMVDVDADVEEAADDEIDAAEVTLPVVDVGQCSNGTEDVSAEANSPESTEDLHASESVGEEVTDDVAQSASLLCETASTPENAEENSVIAVNDISRFPVAESSAKCNDGMEVASETASLLESGIIL